MARFRRRKIGLELRLTGENVTREAERAGGGDILGKIIDEQRPAWRDPGAHGDKAKRRGARLHVADLVAEISLVPAKHAIR